MSSSAHLSNDELLVVYLGEVPNRGAAIFALTAYLAVSLALLAVTIRNRGWFMLTAVLTGFLEFGGFLSRLFMLQNATSGTTVAMQCLLIISPVLLNIIEYVCVAKLIRRSEPLRRIRWLRWEAPLFSASEVLTLGLQGAGGGLLSMAQSGALAAAEMGRKLLLVGLAAQLGFFTLFTVLTIWVNRGQQYGYKDNAQYKRLFQCLYITIALLFVRNIFRVIEFAQGWLGYLATHEVYFYIFDFIPIFSTLVFFTVWHYGWYLEPQQAAAPGEPASPAPKVKASAGSESKSSSVTTASVEDGQVEAATNSEDGSERMSPASPGNKQLRAGSSAARQAQPLELVTIHKVQENAH